MKVVFVHPSHPSQFTRIAQALAERPGWECTGLVHEKFADAVRADDPPIAYYGFHQDLPPGPSASYTQCLEEGLRCGKAVVDALAALRAAGGVDVVIGHAAFGTTFFVREVLQVPVVAYVELPGHFPVYCRDEFPAQVDQRLMDVSLRALIHASVLHSDLCVVPSRHARDLFPPELRPTIRVQPEGFDLPPRAGDQHGLRRELGIPAAAPVIGFAGRTLEAVRGFDVFVRMATAIRHVRPDVRFLVVGDEGTLYGNETAYLDGKSFRQHVVEREPLDAAAFVFRPFMPHDRFIRHLQVMDVAVFPIFEGAGNWSVFEAMAAGVPILASDRCFLPELITHGRDGLLFDPGDVEGLVEAALSILRQPRRREALGREARRTIARRFSLPAAADGYARILTEAAARWAARNRRGLTVHPAFMPLTPGDGDASTTRSVSARGPLTGGRRPSGRAVRSPAGDCASGGRRHRRRSRSR
jgi:glycosyltransferase involved in cell wall biosynthesis